MAERRRERDGVGKGDGTSLKHEFVRDVGTAQILVFALRSSGRGLIVDMHAGDGEGVPRQRGQLHLFEPFVSIATSALAVRWKHQFPEWNRPQVILCESKTQRRRHLEKLYETEAQILSNNKLLTRISFDKYEWALVLNDPNGPADHALEVMQHIGKHIKKSDFLIVTNIGAVKRMCGLRAEPGPKDNAMVRGARKNRLRYRWMLEPKEWRDRLGKDHVFCAPVLTGRKAFKGRVMLVTNYAADGVRRIFEEENR